MRLKAFALFAIGAAAIALWFRSELFFIGKGAVYNVYNLVTTRAPDASVDCSQGAPKLAGFRTEAPSDENRISPLRGDCGWRFVVDQGQPRVKAGVRTEMRSFAAPYDHPTRYCFSVRLPEPWPEASPIVTLAQWHAVPDRVLGELGRSPPLRLQISQGFLETAVMADPRRVTGAPFEGGDPPFYKVLSRTPVDWESWSRWCFDVVWRAGGRGRVDIYRDGEALASHDDALGYHDISAPFFKFGVYVPGADNAPGGRWTAEFADLELTDTDFDAVEAVR